MSSSKPLALVTGGAGGMGLATVERLARDGFSVVMVDRIAELAQRETGRLQALGLDVRCAVVDLTDEVAVRVLVRSLGPISALVNNAGVFDERKFMEVTNDDFRRVYEVNMIAVATLTQEVARTMPEGGRIVNIASRAYLGAKNHPHYVASKAAVVGYTRASAMELAPRGILVNAIAPGLIDTPIYGFGGNAEEFKAKLKKDVLFPDRLGYPSEFASLAVELLTNSYMNAETIRFDGGARLAPK